MFKISMLTFINYKIPVGIKNLNTLCVKNRSILVKNRINIKMSKNMDYISGKKKLDAEKIFFEGPPSKIELIIPFISILTVLGIIPFLATLSRQFWVNYTITNRRISVESGFQRSNRVEIVYKDIKKIKYITRFGGQAADLVLVLRDNAQLELRSLSNWEENYNFIKEKCELDDE